MLALVPAYLAVLMLSASPGCPDTGATTFFDNGNGFQGYRLLGSDSYASFFVGRAFRKAAADESGLPGRAEFWVDRLLVQWQLVPASAFGASSSADRAKLKAWLDFELGYVKRAASKAKASLANIHTFEPFESRA